MAYMVLSITCVSIWSIIAMVSVKLENPWVLIFGLLASLILPAPVVERYYDKEDSEKGTEEKKE